MKLSKISKIALSELGLGTELTCSNMDDVFGVLQEYEITEIEVNQSEMYKIVQVYLSNVGNDKNGNQGKILQEGKIDKFFGIKLVLV